MASSSKKNAASSKTAHVMNLISKHADGEAPAPETPAAAAPQAPAPQPAADETPAPAAPAAQPPILVSLASEAAVSETIKGALEDALEEECPSAPPSPSQSAQEDAPADQAGEDAPQAPPHKDPPWDDLEGTTYVNVMENLVEESVEKYMGMFGLCKCPRCIADVKALALNNLPPKYVVMKQGDVIPRITVYEGRFRTAVTAQILRACQSVMEHPRHDRT
jgi:hypothetical protein